MDFFEWSTLATYSGSLAMVIIITQFTKGIKYIKSIPTQLWSYFVALAVLFSAYYFTSQLDASNAVLLLFNGVVIALAANGGFETLKKIFPDKLIK